MKVHIYILKNPATLEIKYVGKALDVKKRLQRHLAFARDKKNKRYLSNWLRKISLNPILEVIETCELSEWKERETYWILYYKNLGCKLCNLSNGGEGAGIGNKNCLGRTMSEQTKLKIGKANKGRTISSEKFKVYIQNRNNSGSKNGNSKKVIHITSKIKYDSLIEACNLLGLKYNLEVVRIRNQSKKANFKYI